MRHHRHCHKRSAPTSLTSPADQRCRLERRGVGTTAYAVGSFTAARPSGSAPGVNEVTRNNAMAYNITHGRDPALEPEPERSGDEREGVARRNKLYVGGNFNTVGGTSQSKIVAFDLPSGNRDPNFQPSINGTVVGIAVSNTTVYAGGSFLQAGGQSRTNLAAFTRSTGAVTAWAPTADDIVEALVVSPDSSRVVIGGRFQNMNRSGHRRNRGRRRLRRRHPDLDQPADPDRARRQCPLLDHGPPPQGRRRLRHRRRRGRPLVRRTVRSRLRDTAT